MGSLGHLSLIWVILIVKKLLKVLNEWAESECLAQMNRGFSIMAKSTGWVIWANTAIFVVAFKGIFISWNHPTVL